MFFSRLTVSESSKQVRKRYRNQRRHLGRRLLAEALEPRRLLTAYVVDTIQDSISGDGFISLREAINASSTNAAVGDAPAGGVGPGAVDTITFAASLGDAVFTLTGNQLTISDDVQISRGAASSVTINGTVSNLANRVFEVLASAGNVSISGLTITGGVAAEGAGIANRGANLTIIDTIIDNNTANGPAANQGGGGIFSSGGTLTIMDSTISGNTASGAAGSGGGLLSVAGTVDISNTIFSFNTANRAGGGIEVIVGTVTLTDSSLINNVAGPAGSAMPGNGGGLHTTGAANVTIDGGSVLGNTAALEGGGLWNAATSTLTVQNGTVITGNIASGPAADDGGGGIFNNGGIVIINGAMAPVEITGNVADGTAGSGGGILTLGGTLTVTNAIIADNDANRAGGGIEATAGSTTTLTNVTLGGVTPADGNTAGINGGGLHITGAGTATIIASTISNNLAANEGGGLWNSGSGTLTVRDSTISNNAGGDGGGVFQTSGTGTLVVINTTIDSNTASAAVTPEGGGIALRGGTATLRNATFTANAGIGGGIFNAGGTLNSFNTVIALNTSDSGSTTINADVVGAFTTAANTFLGTANGATGITGGANGNIVGANPQLGALTNNGGPTLTRLPITGSPLINAGNNANLTNQPFDQRGTGFARVFDTTVDIGATEVQAFIPGPIVVDTFADIVDPADNLTSLREAIIRANLNPGPDIIVLAAGTYTVTIAGAGEDGTLTGDLDITGELTITGADVDTTIIDGSALGDRVFEILGAVTVSMSGLTITGGTAADVGGGIANRGGNVLLSNVTISDNTANGAAATQGGGGIFSDGGTVTITNSLISNNVAAGTNGSGGALLLASGTMTVTNSTFTFNTANRAGGGIEVITGTLTLTNSSLINNIAGPTGSATPGNGGGLHVTGTNANVTIDGGSVFGNAAAREGGGLWNATGSTLTVRNGTVISANIASGPTTDDGGGGIFNNGGTLVIDGSLTPVEITGNVADGAASGGGGIFTLGGTVTITGASISANEAVTGGGLENFAAGNVTITNSSVSSNLASEEGGGLWNSSTGTLTVNNTTIDLNTASGVAADQGGGGIYNDGGSLSVTGSTISSNIANGTSGSGGGLLSTAGNLVINNSTFTFNTANRAGGGIEVIVGNVTLTDSSLINNVAGPAGSAAPGNGGGLHVSGNTANVTLNGGSVFGNTAAVEGGGLWNQSGSTLIIRNGTLIAANTASGPAADDGGGGIFNNGGIVAIDGSVSPIEISGNVANGVAGSGGGVFSLGGTLTISNTTIASNEANRAGGGIEVTAGSTTTLTNVTLGGNDPTLGNIAGSTNSANPGNGGGLHITGAATVTVTSSTVSNNTSANEGGGLWNSGAGTLNVIASTISNNSSATGGGVFGFGTGGTITITNSTLSGNSATGAGGGLAVQGGNVTITSATVTNNSAASGGGLSVAGGTTLLVNTIVGANTAITGADISGTVSSNGFNLISATSGATITGQSASDITGVNPGLAALADNGGPTLTHALLGNSPALDVGTAAGQTVDQRGISRPQGPNFDIGAFESPLAAGGGGVNGTVSADDLAPGMSGDGNADNFTVVFDSATQQYVVTVNGTVVRRINVGAVPTIIINGSSDLDTVLINDTAGSGQAFAVNTMGGDDAITISRLAAGSTAVIDAGDGSDTINIGNNTTGAADILGAVTVAGGSSNGATRSLRGAASRVSPSGPFTANSVFIEGGSTIVATGDVLNIIDPTATTVTQFVVDLGSQTVTRQFIPIANYSGIESINIVAGSGNDVAEVRLGGATPVVVTFDGNGGNDSLIVTGTAGNDSVFVQRITTDAAPRTNIEVADLECLTFNLFGGNDVAVNDTGGGAQLNSSVPALFNGGDGNDTLVGGNALDVMFGGAGVDALFGGDGNDFLFADSDAAGNLFRAGGELLNGGPGNDTGVSYAATSNSGNDIITEVENVLAGRAGLQFIFFPRDNFTDPDASAVAAARQQALAALAALGCSTQLPAAAVNLRSVSSQVLSGLSLSAAESLQYTFTPDIKGSLTIEAMHGSDLDGSMQLVLVDENMNFIAASSHTAEGERLDVKVDVGQRLQLLVFGNNRDFDVRFTNLVSQNSPLTIHGTAGDDEFELTTDSNGLHFIVNGTRYNYTYAQSREINFLGGGGNDTIRVTAANGTDRVITSGDFATLIGNGYQAQIRAVNSINVLGGNQRPLLQRATRAADVNGDGKVTAADALQVVNFLSRARGTTNVANLVAALNVPVAQWLARQAAVDVTGDNNVTPMDALRVINEIGRIRRGFASEGEQAVDQVMAGAFSASAADHAIDAMFAAPEDDNNASPSLF